jgi:purine-binding chemotaxis protein CheW
MAQLFLLAEINGTAIAIASDVVESVVRVQNVIPVPRADPLVAGIFALRSRVLTLIDTQYAVTSKRIGTPDNALAIIAQIGGCHFGLIVDAVKDVVEIDDNQHEHTITPSAQWGQLAESLVNIDGKIVVVVCPICAASRTIN